MDRFPLPTDDAFAQRGTALTTNLLFVFCFAAFFIAGYAGIQTYLFKSENQRDVARMVGSAHQALCDLGIRFPDTECRQVTLIASGMPDEPLAKAFARMPNMSAVIDKLRWNNGTEADAVRLMAVIRNFGLARTNEARENAIAMDKIARLVRPLWKSYPDMVAASACVYCGSPELLEHLVEGEGPDIDELRSLFSGHPRLFRIIHERQPVEPELQYQVARVYAELGSAGDAGTAEMIAGILSRNDDYERLRRWADSGLNGGRSLSELDLASLPQDLVETAWRQGVGMAYDDFDLTRFLFQQGYRPALRWVVWLQSSEIPYIQGYRYERYARKYQRLLDEHTEFDVTHGVPLARFYNEHWERIVWDSTHETWRLEQ